MPNPYPAEFWGPSRDTRALVVRLGGFVNFTDNANQPGIGSVIVTDGVHTVNPAAEILFTGATVTDEGAGVAGVAISAGGGGLALSSFSFAYNTANLNAGIATGISAVTGKALIGAWLELTANWNGSTPFGDFGVGVGGGGNGVFSLLTSGSFFDMNFGTATGGGVTENQSIGPATWAASGAIQIWVSQDGSKGGTAPGGTTGAATLYVLQTT